MFLSHHSLPEENDLISFEANLIPLSWKTSKDRQRRSELVSLMKNTTFTEEGFAGTNEMRLKYSRTMISPFLPQNSHAIRIIAQLQGSVQWLCSAGAQIWGKWQAQ
jgi:hypothetical protein